VDKIRTGFLTWSGDIKAYEKIDVNSSKFEWERGSQPALDGLAQVLANGEFFNKLVTLWAQESSRSDSNPELRNEHLQFMKSIGPLCKKSLLKVADFDQSENFRG
jgi:proteasome activator subunit 4